MTRTIRVRAHERRKPRKPIRQVWMEERLWNEVVGESLAAELSDVLPKWAEQDRLSQLPEEQRNRIQEIM